jgi:hypothetical protein
MYNYCMSPKIIEITRSVYVEVRLKEKGHNTPHIHVVGPGIEASLSIKDLAVLANSGFKEKDLRKIRDFLMDRLDQIKEAWDEYHS